jgi:rfaE bifunctional protein nucleotidyltransferase chain/domain
MKYLLCTEEEQNLTKDIKKNKGEYVDFFGNIYEKPWGYEYLAYQNDDIGIWILNIDKEQKTSLHCHFSKDTLLFCLKGCAKIELYNDYKILYSGEYLYIPKKKFHGLGTYTDNCLLLEMEIYDKDVTYTDKNDLLRINDIYNRPLNSTYASSVTKIKITSDNIKNYNYFTLDKINNNTNIDNISIWTTDTLKNIEDSSTTIILIDGKLSCNFNIMCPGSIITNTTYISELSSNKYLIMENLFLKEDRKIIYNKRHLKDLITKNDIKKIGLTSGCFDIIHVGHLNFIKNCKKNCDILFVCLSCDEQIKQLKGENRPINNYKDRIQLLKHIDDIDYIILYEETNNEVQSELDNIMNIVNPDIWFKGNDYNKDEIKKKHPCLKNIMIFENIKDKSTTNIINKII